MAATVLTVAFKALHDMARFLWDLVACYPPSSHTGLLSFLPRGQALPTPGLSICYFLYLECSPQALRLAGSFSTRPQLRYYLFTEVFSFWLKYSPPLSKYSIFSLLTFPPFLSSSFLH